MNTQLKSILLATILPLMLVACGGGGGGNNTPAANVQAPVNNAPAAGPSISKVGTITGFGSVFVDGERFETDSSSTEYLKDDEDSLEDELEVGMVVRVRSSSKNSAGEWIAEAIEFDEELKGPVDSVGADSFVAVGQTVLVSADTFFDNGLTLAGLAPGDIVEVSGLRNAADEIEASYVELKMAGSVNKYEVRGQVRNHDANNQQFQIGGLTVNYANALVDDLPNGVQNDVLVEVQDTNLAYMSGDLSLDATKVEGEYRTEFKDEDDRDADGDGRSDDGSDDDSDRHEFEVEALITEVIDGMTFMMGSVEVRHDSTTRFSGGTAADLAEGVRVDVDGRRTADDAIQAIEIEFEDREARLSGLVNEVRVADGELVVMGVTIDVSGAMLEDSRDDVMPFMLEDIAAGDFVDVEGMEADNVIIAMEVEREDASDDSEMRGLLDEFDATAQTVTIFGLLVVTDSSTRYESDDEAISADEFFSRLHVGQSVVEADWDSAQADTLTPVKELSLED